MSTATATAPAGQSFADLTPDLSGGDDTPPNDGAIQNEETHVEPVKPATKPAEKPVEKPAVVKPDAGSNPHLESEPEPAAAKGSEKKDPPAEEEVPKGMTAKAAETWKSLKQAEKAAVAGLAAAQAEKATLQKQLDDATKGAPDAERLKAENEELKARLTEFESELSVGRIEATRQFKERASGPMKASEESVKALATKYEVGSAALLDAIREPDADKRADLLSELSAEFKSYDSKRLFDAADSYAAASAAGEEMRKNAGSKLEEITKQSQQEAERMATANISDFRKAADTEWKALQERFPILRPVDGKPDWNAYLDSIKQDIESVDVNDLPVAEVAQMRAQAKALPEIVKALTHFQKKFDDEKKKRVDAEERLKEFRATEPGAGGGSTTRTEAGGVKSFADLPDFK